MLENKKLIEKIISLCKQRGFVYPGSEIYGGLQNSWDYGPLGVELKNNIKQLWWNNFVRQRDDIEGLDAALIMNPKIWAASGHLSNFNDPLVECDKCHSRFRADEYGIEVKSEKIPGLSDESYILDIGPMDIETACKNCGSKGTLSNFRRFNLMLKTFLGPLEDSANTVYLRPETAQAIFVDFKNVMNTSRQSIPFGIAQIGKAFRNEITPGNFIFRTREFEQMEIEYFIEKPNTDKDWEKYFDEWKKAVYGWIEMVGIDKSKIHELDVPKDELAHYSKKTIDFEFDFPFGREELYSLGYRTDFDLRNHETISRSNTKFRNAETGEEYWPHVIEPSMGVDRTLLAVLCSAYCEEGDRVILKLSPKIAPYKAAVFPLMRNKPELVKLAREIYDDLRKEISIAWDDRGNIGKRYYAQDQIGTPVCITVDYDSLEDKTVTVRDRDTAKQQRVKVEELKHVICNN
jgi:glycyl-tRNA synthetase